MFKARQRQGKARQGKARLSGACTLRPEYTLAINVHSLLQVGIVSTYVPPDVVSCGVFKKGLALRCSKQHRHQGKARRQGKAR